MKHKRNAARFLVAIFWAVVIGIAATAISNASSAHAIGWATWLFYGTFAVPTVYFGVFATKRLWSVK